MEWVIVFVVLYLVYLPCKWLLSGVSLAGTSVAKGVAAGTEEQLAERRHNEILDAIKQAGCSQCKCNPLQ